jgi:hypothetical protein
LDHVTKQRMNGQERAGGLLQSISEVQMGYGLRKKMLAYSFAFATYIKDHDLHIDRYDQSAA